jgi:CRP/FNR family transcriptional regulator, cyclic AMP receptor protein
MPVTSAYGSFDYADLPLATYRADEVVLAAGSRDRPAAVSQGGRCRSAQAGHPDRHEPGAVFGEISALLDRPHTADVRALTPSQFYMADADLLGRSAAALFYIAGVLAQHLDRANEGLVVSLRPR